MLDGGRRTITLQILAGKRLIVRFIEGSVLGLLAAVPDLPGAGESECDNGSLCHLNQRDELNGGYKETQTPKANEPTSAYTDGMALLFCCGVTPRTTKESPVVGPLRCLNRATRGSIIQIYLNIFGVCGVKFCVLVCAAAAPVSLCLCLLSCN